MAIISWLMGTRVGRLVSSLLAGAMILIAAFQYGRQSQAAAQRIKKLEGYVETKKEIENVETSPGRSAAIERLRRNGILSGRDL